MNIAKSKDLPKVVKSKLGLGSDTNCKSPRGGEQVMAILNGK